MNWKNIKWIWRARAIPASAFSSGGRNSGWTSQPSDQRIHLRHPLNHTRTNPGLGLFHLQFRMVPVPAGAPHFVLRWSSPGTKTDTRKNTDLVGHCSWIGFDGTEEWGEWSRRRTGSLHSQSVWGASTPDTSWTSWGALGIWVFLICGGEERVWGDEGRVCGKRVMLFWAFFGRRWKEKEKLVGYNAVAVRTVRHGEESEEEEWFKVRKRWRDRSQAVKGVVGCVL